MGVTKSAMAAANRLGCDQSVGTVVWEPSVQYTARGSQGGGQSWNWNGFVVRHYRARNGWRYFYAARSNGLHFYVFYWLALDKGLAMDKAMELSSSADPESVTLSRTP